MRETTMRMVDLEIVVGSLDLRLLVAMTGKSAHCDKSTCGAMIACFTSLVLKMEEVLGWSLQVAKTQVTLPSTTIETPCAWGVLSALYDAMPQ
jgi:hypothetical protein